MEKKFKKKSLGSKMGGLIKKKIRFDAQNGKFLKKKKRVLGSKMGGLLKIKSYAIGPKIEKNKKK